MRKFFFHSLLAVCFAQVSYQSVRAQTPVGYEPYAFATLAGLPPGKTEGQGAAARFQRPQSAVCDSAGNVYVVDGNNHSIRKVTPAGEVSTFAGRSGVSGYAEGQGDAARFYYPMGIAIDAAGNFWVADSGNAAIRKITPSGLVSTFVGGTVGTGSADGFYYLAGIAVDKDGSIYVTDDETVRKITPAGVVSTLSGMPGCPGYQNGPGTQARFDGAAGIVVTNNGYIVVADANNGIIRVVDSTGYTVDFSYIPFTGNQTEDSVPYDLPTGLAIDGVGNVFVADAGASTVREIVHGTGDVHTIAGSGMAFPGSVDGIGTAARFTYPTGAALDSFGNIYVTDTSNATVRKIDSNFVVTTVAGLPTRGMADGLGSSARFAAPAGVAVDRAGNTYVADVENATIRKVTPGGAVSTLAGHPGVYGNADGNGSAAQFSGPQGVAVDGAGNVFVADTYNSAIRKITPTGDVSTVASVFYIDILGNFFYGSPDGVAVDAAGTVYVAATAISAIYKITPDGNVSVFAGMPGKTGLADGTGSAARFNHPWGMALDVGGNIFVADSHNRKIRKITPEGVVTSIGTDGIYPLGVTVDKQGGILFTSLADLAIRRISPGGGINIVAGDDVERQHADGIGSDARFWRPSGMATDQAGNVYVADTHNNVIRVGLLAPAAPGLTRLPQSHHLLVAGKTAANATVDLMASTELTSGYTTIATTIADAGGNYQFEDAGNGSFAHRFYEAAVHVPVPPASPAKTASRR
ncbi:MAG: NHL repeat-containing protein [Chthoniobacterales bacterium]